MLLSLAILSSIVAYGKGKNSVRLVFGGDVSFNGIVEYLVNKDHCTYEESLERLRPYVINADYFVVNLESVMFPDKEREEEDCVRSTAGHSISDESALKSLTNIGVNCVTIANDHISDFLEAGINSTEKLCDKRQVEYFGISYGSADRTRQNPLILEKHGVKIGMLGYCATKECIEKEVDGRHGGATLFSLPVVVSQVKELREAGCHIVILYMNWEEEYSSVMSIKSMMNVKRLLRQVKVDVIVGSHPHVTHGHWIVNDTLVASSLGNLLHESYMTASLNFDKKYLNTTTRWKLPAYEKLWYKQMSTMRDPTRQGKLLQIQVNKNGIIPEKSTYLPTRMFTTDKHCMVVDKELLTTWRSVCDIADPQCVGTRECNYLECDQQETLPPELY